MSFSASVKNELINAKYENACCRRAMLYGLCLFGRKFSETEICLQTEHRPTAELFVSLLKEIFNIDAPISPTPQERIFNVSITKKSECEKIIRTFEHENVVSLKINYSNFTCDECTHAFTAGAFLACGTVSDPSKDYHLEFSLPYHNLSKDLFTLLQELELSPKYANRKGYNIVYFKESESIENCLYIMGAPDAMFEMMNIEIVKDFRNKANRKTNCENANINKMAEAAAIQVNAIEKIHRLKGKNYLPPQLEEAAQLRLANPDMSLSELAASSPQPISRSGLNHRLHRIVEIAAGLGKK